MAGMKRVWLLVLWAVGLTGPGGVCAAEENGLRASKPGVKDEVVAVVEAQLAAFRAAEITKAYGYASAALRAQNPLQKFAAIVQTNYPEIWANVRSEHGLVRDDGARATVTVRVFSKESEAAYDYVLLKERGGWRIGSVLRHEPKKKESV